MNRQSRTIVVLAIALVMAGIASYWVYRTVKAIPVQQVEVANYKVVVASRPLTMGTRLTAEDLKLVSWPTSSPVATAHSEITAVVNRGLLSPLLENEPVTESKLAPLEAGAGLSPTIPQGMRAMSVRVNEVVGVAGFVTPGTRVDVLVTLRRGNNESQTQTVTSNTQVLTAGTKIDQEKAKDGEPIPSTVVTLMVTPTDAERIALAQSQGEIMLSLRNPLDTAVTATDGAQVGDLFGQPRPVAAAPVTQKPQRVKPIRVVPEQAPPPVQPYMVESIKGAKKTTEQLKEIIREPISKSDDKTPEKDAEIIHSQPEVIR